jgi:hypothetical protein
MGLGSTGYGTYEDFCRRVRTSSKIWQGFSEHWDELGVERRGR